MGKKALDKQAEIMKEKPEKPNATFGDGEVSPLPTAKDIKAKLGWTKLKSVARFNGIRLPMGPRTSIAVEHSSELMRSEIMELMAKNVS